MIPQGPAPAHAQDTTATAPADWQRSLREAYRDPRALLVALQLDPEAVDWLDAGALDFPLRVPRGFVQRMQPGNPRDPLLLQVLPRRAEAREAPGYVADPLNEREFHHTPGLIHKYHGRALLITTAACGIHCRYCFRRSFPYDEAREGADGWAPALATLEASPDIEEIILSGGDPLSLSDARLQRLFDRLEAIPHLRRLRIHSRQPVVLPERITDALLAMLGRSRLQQVMVLHSNHPNELDGGVEQALARLRQRGITLLNQSVLLAGVNDDAQVLARLSKRLFSCGVLPYYLHGLDRVAGSAHFEVTDAAARGIMRSLNAMLPGYLVPRLVRELPGASGKLPVHW